jgi:hypothetical protein
MDTRLDVMISAAQASKSIVKAAFIASVLGGSLVWQSSAIAAPKLQIIPSDRVSVAGVKREKPTRSLVLRTDSKIDNLKVIPTDLMGKDGKEVFAAQWVKPGIPELMELKPGTPVTIPIAFNLENLQTSGDFSGVLLIQYEGGEMMIPLQVQVKDDWQLPVVWLIVGVGVALLLAWYQSEGMERDEILQRMGRVRLQMEADAQVPESFRASIQRGLIGIETALEERRWECAAAGGSGAGDLGSLADVAIGLAEAD